MSIAEYALPRPFWEMQNSFTIPNIRESHTGRAEDTSLKSFVTFSLPITIFLDTLFTDLQKTGRNIEDDQLNIFHSIEGSLSGLGVDGRSCMLRLICELQGNSIGQYSIIGELLSVLFTPKRGLKDFFHEYLEAEVVGQDDQDCTELYHTCPFSIMNAARMYQQFAKGYSSAKERPQISANAIHKEHHSLPKIELH
ncbi:unnamed protein product [Meganyctiphanes norvegica]|uniref:Uncharacterized protein n=1 Tax=Meganyctiphanes norvegica TaxID=48144 RepID=A0AAV2QRV0_MEGNR